MKERDFQRLKSLLQSLRTEGKISPERLEILDRYFQGNAAPSPIGFDRVTKANCCNGDLYQAARSREEALTWLKDQDVQFIDTPASETIPEPNNLWWMEYGA